MHAPPEVRLGRLDEQMDVIGHEAVREAVPAEGLDDAAKQAEIRPSVVLVEKDQPAFDATSEYVMNAGLGLVARQSSHTGRSARRENFAPGSK